MSVQDDMKNFLRTAGVALGPLPDMEKTWLRSQTALSTNVDMWKRYLIAQGYAGTVGEMKKKWFVDEVGGGGSPPVELVTASFFNTSTENGGTADPDTGSYTLGSKVRVMANGQIKKLRFWKPTANVQTGRSWGIWMSDSPNTLLATGTTTGELAGGNWVEWTLPTPLNVVYGQELIIGCTTNKYSGTAAYFANEIRRSPVVMYAQACRYAVGASLAMPTLVSGSPNYWVDLVLEYNTNETYYTPLNHVSETLIPGGYPTSATTGLSNPGILTPASWVRSASDGQIIENLDIFGSVYITHNNVTIRNCRIVAHTPYHIIQQDGGTNLTVTRCEINGRNIAVNGVLGAGTFSYNKIYGVQNGLNGTGTWTNNYINDMGAINEPEPHYDGTETNGGTVVIQHNTILVGTSQTSAVMLNNFFGAMVNCLIEDNILVGGGYTCYCDNTHGPGVTSNVQFNNNKMLPGAFGYFSLYTSGATHTGNTNLTTGLSVDG